MNKHEAGSLRYVLEETLGDKRVGDAKTRLLVPAWNPVARSVYIYKTAHHKRRLTDYTGFHLDVLPAVADRSGLLSTVLAITDKDGSTYSWSASDPRGYGAWFDDRNKVAFELAVVE
jgi:hypothetical protein